MNYQVSVKIKGDRHFFVEIEKRLKYYFEIDSVAMTIKGRLDDEQLPTFWNMLYLDANVKVGKTTIIVKTNVADWDETTVRCHIKPVVEKPKPAEGVQLCLLPGETDGTFWRKTIFNIEMQKLARLIRANGENWYWEFGLENQAF